MDDGFLSVTSVMNMSSVPLYFSIEYFSSVISIGGVVVSMRYDFFSFGAYVSFQSASIIPSLLLSRR